MSERKVKGSNLPSINISKQILSLLNRLTGDEIKIIFNAVQKYVYKGEDVEVDEDLEDVLEIVLDNIEQIGVKYLNKATTNRENGKKGGRPRKNVESENNPILTHQMEEDDKVPTPVMEMPLKGQKNTLIPNINLVCETAFEKVIKDYKNNINDIIIAYKKNDALSKRVGNTLLQELLNRGDTKPYAENIRKYIEERVA